MSVIVRGKAPLIVINDDFDGSAVDTARWDVYSNQSVTVSNSAVTLNKTTANSSYMAFLYSKMVYDGVSDYEVEFSVTGMTGSVYEPDFGIFAPEDGLASTVCGIYLNPSNYTNNNGIRLCINGAFSKVIDQLKTAFHAKFIYRSVEKKLEIYIDDILRYSGTHDFASYAGTRLCFARVTGSYAKSISIGKITARNLSSYSDEAVNREVSAITAGAADGVNRTMKAVYRAVGGVERLVFGQQPFPPLDPSNDLLIDDDYYAKWADVFPHIGGSSGSGAIYDNSWNPVPPYGVSVYKLYVGSAGNCIIGGNIFVPSRAKMLVITYARGGSTGTAETLQVNIDGSQVWYAGNSTDISWKTAQIDISEYCGRNVDLSIIASFSQGNRSYAVNRIYFTS